MKLSQSVKAAIDSLSKVSRQHNFLRDIFLPRLADIWVEFAEKGQGTSFFTRKPQVERNLTQFSYFSENDPASSELHIPAQERRCSRSLFS